MDAVAVTSGPGLAGALMVGVSAAKAVAVGLGKPLYGVNHLAAHVAVDQLEHGPLAEPTVALLVSGGHSSLLMVQDVTGDVEPLGATIDDAAGGRRQGGTAAGDALSRRPSHRSGSRTATGRQSISLAA